MAINIATSATHTSITSASTVIAQNNSRVGGFIQNLGTNKLYVKFGTGCADTIGDFSAVLVGGIANDDGNGGILPLTEYCGPVTFAGTSPRAIVVEDVR